MDLNISNFILTLFCIISAIGGLGVILSKKAMSSAIFLIMTLISIAGVYLLLEAPLVAAIQMIVYAGAIMVLFVFIIMLLNATDTDLNSRKSLLSFLGILAGTTFIILLIAAFSTIKLVHHNMDPIPGISIQHSDLLAVSSLLFTKYLFPFELVSIALLIAIVGVVILSKKERNS